MDVVISISRYLLPFLALVILTKCLVTLLLGHPQEKTYGYLIDQVDGQRYVLNMWETSIGRSKHCDIVIGYETISRSHAVISRRIDGWYIYDLNSKSGILVNGKRTEQRAQIKPGDLITMGSMAFRFAVIDDPVIRVGKKQKQQIAPQPIRNPAAAAPTPPAQPDKTAAPEQPLFTPMDGYDETHKPQLQFQKQTPDRFSHHPAQTGGPIVQGDDIFSDSSRAAQQNRATLKNIRTGETFLLSGNRISIGRSHTCDITLTSPDVSRRHALLILYEDGWAIDDCTSTHGTVLNGNNVRHPQLLFPGDVITIGSQELVFRNR